ncbi:MAG: AI-2E family transporter [bacterium]|nr:AI-2E family transporter [bacterium]
MMDNEKVLDISWGTILKLAVTIVCFYIIFLIKDILIWFFFAIIISILFNPVVDFLEKKKVPRVMGVVLIYSAFLGLLSVFMYLSVILFLAEIKQFSQFLPQYWGKLSPLFQSLGLPIFENTENFFQTLGGNLEKVSRSLADVVFLVFGGIFSTILTITMAVFISLEQKPIERWISLFFSKHHEAYALSLWERCQKKVSGWFLMRIIACIFVGGLSYFTFFLFNLKYSFSLGLIAGVLNFIPIVGPIATGILIFIIALFDSLAKGVFIVIAFILIQQVENNILTPILSKKFIGMSPILVLASLSVGGTLWGILGAILAVPLAGILFEFLKEFLQQRKKETKKSVVL